MSLLLNHGTPPRVQQSESPELSSPPSAPDLSPPPRLRAQLHRPELISSSPLASSRHDHTVPMLPGSTGDSGLSLEFDGLGTAATAANAHGTTATAANAHGTTATATNVQGTTATATTAHGTTATATTATATTQAKPTPTQRRPRKKKDTDGTPTASNASDASATKVKKPRIPRGTGPQALKKKAEREAQRLREAELAKNPNSCSNGSAGSSTAAANPAVTNPAAQTQGQTLLPRPTTDSSTAANPPAPSKAASTVSASPYPMFRNRSTESLSNSPHSSTKPTIPQPLPKSTSGQKYDPIRSSTIFHSQPSLAPAPRSTPTPNGGPTRTASSQAIPASRSPAISSLIEPPPPPASLAVPSVPDLQELGSSDPPEAKRLRLSPPLPKSDSAPASQDVSGPSTSSFTTISTTSNTTVPSAVTDPASSFADAKSTTNDQALSNTGNGNTLPNNAVSKPTDPLAKKTAVNAPKTASSGPTSPKPTRSAKEPPKMPTGSGSGLLTGAIFGRGLGGDDLGDGAEKASAPSVILHVTLNGDNNYVNFARLAEEKYGFNALHPRLAAQKERLARVAAAGALLENLEKKRNGMAASADGDASVDLSNEENDQSNVEMGGMDGVNGQGINGRGSGGSGEDNAEARPQRKKRIMKEDMYDVDDDFVDDTEMAWEEQAAVSKDGFFVYSGPLVPEGEEAKIERTDEPTQRRRTTGSRGRGGRGSRGGRTTTTRDRNTATTTTTNGTSTNTNTNNNDNNHNPPATNDNPPSTTTNPSGRNGPIRKDGKPRRPRRTKEEIQAEQAEKAQRQAQKEPRSSPLKPNGLEEMHDPMEIVGS